MKALTKEFLLPNCRVRSEKVGGSGTVVYSAKNKKGVFSTYVLTNHHVVENNIKVDTRWSTLLKKDVKMDILGTVQVEFFKWQYQSRAIGATAIDADIMTYMKDEDLALLKLRDDEAAPAVARLYPRDKVTDLRLGMPVMAIGAALGEAPVITVGRLSGFAKEIDNREYWLSTAPTIFGNSGGAVYLEETEEFIGIPSALSVLMQGFAMDAITHMSYSIPITRIYNFLERQLFRFIYDSKFTEESEEAERERRRKEEERKMAIIEEPAVEKGQEPTSPPDDTPPWRQ